MQEKFQFYEWKKKKLQKAVPLDCEIKNKDWLTGLKLNLIQTERHVFNSY